MENLLLGSTALVLCGALWWFAWRKAHQNQIYVALGAIILSGLLLRVYVATDHQLHEWDERYHALVAKNLLENPLQPTLYRQPVLPYDYRNWTNNHIWLHKQPLALWSMAGSMKIFGVNVIALRLPSILLSTLAIWLTFQIALYFFDPKTALLAAFLHAIHGLSIELTGGRIATDHIDIHYLFFIELAIYLAVCFLQKPKWYVSVGIGVSLGAAILTKWLPALIVFPIYLLLTTAERFPKRAILVHGALIVLAATAVALPWQLYIMHIFPLESAWEYQYNARHLHEALEGHRAPWYYHWWKMPVIFGQLIFIPLAWFTYDSLKRARKQDWPYLAITVWIWLPYLFFTLAATKMQAYILFTAPGIFMITAWCWYNIKALQARPYSLKHVFKVLVLFFLIALPLRYTIERTKALQQRERNPTWVANLKALNNYTTHPERSIFFNVDRPIEAMFYSNVTAYQQWPVDQQVLDRLQAEGYQIFVCKNKEKLDCYLIQ